MTRRRRPWDRHRELADKDTASRWPSSAKSMFDGDGNADRPIYISQTSASSRSSYFTREGLRRARSFRRRPNRVHRTRLGRTAHTRQSDRGRGRMRDPTRSPEYDGSSSGVVSYAFSSCRDNKSNSPSHSRRSNRYTNYMSHASPCSAGSTSACGYRPRTPRKPNEFGASGVPPPCEPITITERAMKSESPPASRTSKRME